MAGAGCAGTSRDGYAISFGDNPKPQAFSVARRGGCLTAGLRVDWSQRAVKKNAKPQPSEIERPEPAVLALH